MRSIRGHLKTNHEWTQMDTNEPKLLLKEEVFQIVGCALEVLNTLGHGIIEKPYENVLAVEFTLRKIPFRQQPPFPGGVQRSESRDV